MANAWIAHVKKTRSSMPAGTPLKAVLKKASTTWK